MKAIFIDRDGTLIDEPETEIINTWDKFNIKKEINCLQELLSEYKIFIISNQEGINEAKLEESFYKETNEKLVEVLGENNVRIEKIYTCPHAVAENCNCRKPKTGLIDLAKEEFGIDPENSWVVGDRISDILLAKNIGAKSVFITSSNHTPESSSPDFIADDLCGAIQYINNNS